MILFDKGNVSLSSDWDALHNSYVQSIRSVVFPENADTLTLREKERIAGGWKRNGVGYLRSSFFNHLTDIEGWYAEENVDLNQGHLEIDLQLYPSLENYREPITSNFGGFDFVTDGPDGTRVAIEWETGNISSSHRSMNKLAIALENGVIDAGVLIVPSQSLYTHLTDRIGNIGELSGYLGMWESLKFGVEKGLLAISVVEHDFLTTDPSFPYLPTGNDGRARQGRERLAGN